MTSDTIKLGETYDLSVTVNDADGDPITLDGTYSAAYRVNTAIDASGTDIALAAMTIADGKATASIDTGATGWATGIYYYDVRITDPDGHDYWSETIKLNVVPRITAAS
jgi:hypothetical protein